MRLAGLDGVLPPEGGALLILSVLSCVRSRSHGESFPVPWVTAWLAKGPRLHAMLRL